MKAIPYVENGETTGYMIFCPACECGHLFNIKPGSNGVGGQKPVWGFNGNMECPTFTPSMLVKTNDPSHKHYQPKAYSSVCHSFVADGSIRFLDDCTHVMAGQTVELVHYVETDQF